LASVPTHLAPFDLTLSDDGACLTYIYTAAADGTEGDSHGIADLLEALASAGIAFRDLHTAQSSLEDIFVSLLRRTP
ncbi:MAG: multidrug ABC transporter ATP-binding protein, partial [Phenylobacterium sp.]|nr:multidrug ABC transporter ATP-binding protein [Phenylobacterium sp.]